MSLLIMTRKQQDKRLKKAWDTMERKLDSLDRKYMKERFKILDEYDKNK